MLKKSRSIEKSPKPEGLGDFEVQKEKSALGELRSAPRSLQAVLLLAENEKPVGIPCFFGCPNFG